MTIEECRRLAPDFSLTRETNNGVAILRATWSGGELSRLDGPSVERRMISECLAALTASAQIAERFDGSSVERRDVEAKSKTLERSKR